MEDIGHAQVLPAQYTRGLLVVWLVVDVARIDSFLLITWIERERTSLPPLKWPPMKQNDIIILILLSFVSFFQEEAPMIYDVFWAGEGGYLPKRAIFGVRSLSSLQTRFELPFNDKDQHRELDLYWQYPRNVIV